MPTKDKSSAICPSCGAMMVQSGCNRFFLCIGTCSAHYELVDISKHKPDAERIAGV